MTPDDYLDDDVRQAAHIIDLGLDLDTLIDSLPDSVPAHLAAELGDAAYVLGHVAERLLGGLGLYAQTVHERRVARGDTGGQPT